MLQFTDSAGLMFEGPTEESHEPAIKIEPQNHDACILTFQNVVNDQPLQDVVESVDDETVVSAPPNFRCKICHLFFQSKRTLLIHQKRKHKIYRRSFIHICDFCGMSYDQKNSLMAHIKRKHGPDASAEDHQEQTCDICALVFKGKNRLRMHMRRKHNAFEESFTHVCSECGLTYDKYRSLFVHMQRKHSKEIKPAIDQWYSCPSCPKIFNKRETYTRHVQRKHQVNDEGIPKSAEEFFESYRNEAGEIACKECPLIFSSISFLKLHMRRKHNAFKEYFRLRCKFCNLSYNRVESLKRHIKRKHDQGTYCKVCNKQFDTREMYLNHSHVKVVKECPICNLIFASQGGLAKHLRCTHKIDAPKTFFCNICNEGFYEKRQLKPHLQKVHLKVLYTCKYCKKELKTKESYKRHMIFKHPISNQAKDEMQKCEQCFEPFPNEFELCRHVNFAHGHRDPVVVVKKEDGDIQTFQCIKCPETYSSWENLKLHYEQNHYTAKCTQCQMCGEMVPETDLQKHIKVHNMENFMVQCRFCDYKTKIKASMTQHMLRHKNATTLHCDFSGCKYKSFYEDAMKKHKQKHAEIGVKLQCTQCPFQTMNKYILKYHEEAHMTGKKRYSCNQCDYATILPANLVQHKYKHSTEKRFKCEMCPFATKYNTSLRFHVKKKHCDLPA